MSESNAVKVFTDHQQLINAGYRMMGENEVKDPSVLVPEPDKNLTHISSLRQPTESAALDELLRRAQVAGADAVCKTVVTNSIESSGYPLTPFLYSGILYVKVKQ